MLDLIGNLGGALVKAYNQKQLLDFLTDHFPIAGCVIGALVILAVILPIGPDWIRKESWIGKGIAAGGLMMMVVGFLWAGAIAVVNAERTPTREQGAYPERKSTPVKQEQAKQKAETPG